METPSSYLGFFESYVGSLSVASIIYHSLGLVNESNDFNSQVQKAFDGAWNSSVYPLDSGKAGTHATHIPSHVVLLRCRKAVKALHFELSL